MCSSIAESKPTDDVSVILYHKSPTSGRTRFLRHKSGTLCAFNPLPKLSEVMDHESLDVVMHPKMLVQKTAQWLEYPEEDIEIDSEYCERVDVSGGPLTVYLARFKTIDPPFDTAERIGAKFIAITEAVDALPAELELLRRAYSVIMEG